MFEGFSLMPTYPNSNFPHPWDVANFVSAGKRLQKLSSMTEEQYLLIDQCWKQDPKERMTIKGVLSILNKMKGVMKFIDFSSFIHNKKKLMRKT